MTPCSLWPCLATSIWTRQELIALVSLQVQNTVDQLKKGLFSPILFFCYDEILQIPQQWPRCTKSKYWPTIQISFFALLYLVLFLRIITPYPMNQHIFKVHNACVATTTVNELSGTQANGYVVVLGNDCQITLFVKPVSWLTCMLSEGPSCEKKNTFEMVTNK